MSSDSEEEISKISHREKLKATLEGKKLSRMNEESAFKKLKELEGKLKNMQEGPKKERLQVVFSVLNEEMTKKVETFNNMQFGGNIEGGCGYGGGGGSGNDAG